MDAIDKFWIEEKLGLDFYELYNWKKVSPNDPNNPKSFNLGPHKDHISKHKFQSKYDALDQNV